MRFILPILMTLTLGCGHNEQDNDKDGDGVLTEADTGTATDADTIHVICSGDYEVRNHAELAALEGCTIIEGNLTIGRDVGGEDDEPNLPSEWKSTIANLNALSSLWAVSGRLRIFNTGALTNLEGLESLSSIGGLSLFYNGPLTSLEGLEGLSSIKGDVYIWENDALTSLEGLDGLSLVEGDLIFYGNSSLCREVVNDFVDAMEARGWSGSYDNIVNADC